MSSAKQLILMTTLTLMWSPSFFFIKLALESFPPMTIVALRVSLAAIVLTGILVWNKIKLPTDLDFWVRISMMAIFAAAVPFCLFCYAEQSIDSALAAILNGSSPMFTAVLAQIFVASDKMNRQKFLGVIFSCAGLVLLFAPKLMEGVDGTTLGMAAALMASFCYSSSHIYGKLYLSGNGIKPFVAPAAQFIATSVMICPLAAYHDQIWTLSLPSLNAISGIFGLVFFGSVTAFIIYYKLLEHCGPTAISTVACFFPVAGMFLGFVFLGEAFTSTSLLASGIVFLGMLLVNEVVKMPLARNREETIVD